MDYEQFSEALAVLGISKSDFVESVGMTKSSISHWSGSNRVPTIVSVHVGLLLKVHHLRESLLKVIDQEL